MLRTTPLVGGVNFMTFGNQARESLASWKWITFLLAGYIIAH